MDCRRSRSYQSYNSECRSILCRQKYTYTWIPWWKSPDYTNPSEYKFTEIYLQPNYFFNDVDASRLQDACDEANKHSIYLEVEFDESVLGGKGAKINDYLNVFEDNGIFDEMPLAYYQSINTVLQLQRSSNPSDKALCKRFCDIASKI